MGDLFSFVSKDSYLLNPLFSIYHKSPNERFIHKGDYFCYRQAITPAEIFNNYDLTLIKLIYKYT